MIAINKMDVARMLLVIKPEVVTHMLGRNITLEEFRLYRELKQRTESERGNA